MTEPATQTQSAKKTRKKTPGRWSAIDKISIKKVKLLALDGWTDQKIADFFDISVSGLCSYRNKHHQFKSVLKGWKDLADVKVEKCLYKRAIGYKYNEVTYEKSNVGGLGLMLDDSEIEGIKHTDTAKTKIVVKSVVPDVTAQIFWLKNRQPNNWRDQRDVNVSGEIKLINHNPEPEIVRDAISAN